MLRATIVFATRTSAISVKMPPPFPKQPGPAAVTTLSLIVVALIVVNAKPSARMPAP